MSFTFWFRNSRHSLRQHSSWLRGLTSRVAGSRSAPNERRKRRPRRSSKSWRIVSAPATITWNNLNGGDWNTGSNWSGGVVPGTGDDAVITRPNPGATVTYASGSDVVHSLTSQAPITLSGGSLDVAASSTVNGNLSLSNATLGGTGDLTVHGTFTAYNSTIIAVGGPSTLTLDGGGTLDIATLDGVTLVNPAGQTLILTGFFFDIPGDSDNLLDGATLKNCGTIINPVDVYVTGDGTGTIDNYGLFDKTGGVTPSPSKVV